MNTKKNKYGFCGIFSSVALVALVVVLSACSNPNNPQSYLKTFDHILTDQYVWGYGGGGIYWVSNEHVLLEAKIRDEKGDLDLGIYEVDVRDGSYIKIIEVPDQTQINYTYCFDGKTLHVMRSLGTFTQTNRANGYQVEIRELGTKSNSNLYSPLRCDFVERPAGDAGYIALRYGDGFIKYVREEEKRHIFLVDDAGVPLKKLIKQDAKQRISIDGMFEVSSFWQERNAYFGYSTWDSKNCSELWWLYRADWSIDNKKICLDEEIEGGSRLLHSLKDALFLEHYGGRRGRSYVLNFKGDPLIVEQNHGRGASVSPNGCLVAYGEGDRDKLSGVRQVLKLFNYCAFRSSKSN
jgi:hypothetical protein